MYRLSDNSRFIAALAVAVAAHAALLVSIDFPGFAPPEMAPSITITLAGYQQPTTPAVTPDPVEPPATPAAPAPQPEVPPPPLTVEPQSPAPAPLSRPFAGKTAVDLARDIAALDRTESPSADPTQRVRRLLAGASTTPEFAFYLEAWRRKVERIGNLNYPREARSRGLSGSLRLLVTITADGALRDVRVLETSGHRTLDEAAVHIVRLAAPYAPFSPKMRASTDLLEIERTWHFRNSRYSS
ncbi:MAG: TonB family protein [Gammaproteobacteria bacterium]|nr:TonB family protein [Gammaproteobacteria bacterium]